MSAAYGLIVKPEMPLGDFLKIFDLSLADDQYEKPLEARHVGYLEMTRTDRGNDGAVQVRLSIRYDENLEIEIALPKGDTRPMSNDTTTNLVHEPPCLTGETEVSRHVAVWRFGEAYCPACSAVLRQARSPSTRNEVKPIPKGGK